MKTPHTPEVKKNILFRLAILLSPFFALTFFTALFGYAPLGTTPSAMAGDSQYLTFLSSLHSTLRGKGFFDFAELASDASPLFARYAGSPFTWLLALLPDTLHASASFLTLALKSGLAALAFSFYLSHRRQDLSSPFLFILSFCYSLPCCLSLANGMALLADQLILLPLLLLSLELFFQKGKSGLLIFSLTFIFLTGYTVLYATVFFAVVALALAFLEGRIKCADVKSSAVKLIFACAVSLLLALPILLHALANLGSVGTLATYSGTFVYRLPLLLLTFLPGVTIPEFPTFYIGLLPLLLLPLFFASRAFSRRYRASVAVALVLLCACFFFVNPFGGALSFGLSLLVLLAASDALSARGEGNKLCLIITSGALLFLPIILQKIAYRVPAGEGDTEILSSLFGVYIPLTLVFLASLVLSSLLENKKPTKVLCGLLIVIVLADGFATTFSRTSGKTFLETEKVTLSDAGEITDLLLSRAEKTPSPTERTRLFITGNAKIPYDRAYLFGTEDAPSLAPDLARTLSLFGYDMNADRDGMPFRVGDLFLGVSRYISDTPLTASYYYSLENHDGYTLYSANALPTVFAASRDVLDFEFKGNSPFLYTNAFVSALLGEVCVIYRPLDGVTVTEKENGVTLEGHTQTAGILCYYGEKIGSANLNVTANGQTVRPYADGTDRGIRIFGTLTSGSTVSAVLNGKYPVREEHFQVADSNALNDTITTLGSTRLQNATLRKNVLTGEITLNESTPILMTTLPYDGDYTVTLDGKAVKTHNVEGFLAVSVSESGTHTVSIERPATLGIDMLPTAIGLAGTLAALVLLFLKNKKEKQEKTK